MLLKVLELTLVGVHGRLVGVMAGERSRLKLGSGPGLASELASELALAMRLDSELALAIRLGSGLTSKSSPSSCLLNKIVYR